VTSVITLNAALGILSGLVAGVGSDLLGGPKIITIVFAGTAAIMCIIVLLASSTVRNYRLSQGIVSNPAKKPSE
jgi:sugar phosphate permease